MGTRRAHLLGLETDDKGRDVDHLLADADVALPDEDPGVVDRLGEAGASEASEHLSAANPLPFASLPRRSNAPALEDLSLEPPLEKVLNLEGEHVIEPHAGVVEHADADEAADERIALEQALGVLVVELEELSGRTTDLQVEQVGACQPEAEGAVQGGEGGEGGTHLGQGQRDTPDLALVAETVLAGELEGGEEGGGGGRESVSDVPLVGQSGPPRRRAGTSGVLNIAWTTRRVAGRYCTLCAEIPWCDSRGAEGPAAPSL